MRYGRAAATTEDVIRDHTNCARGEEFAVHLGYGPESHSETPCSCELRIDTTRTSARYSQGARAKRRRNLPFGFNLRTTGIVYTRGHHDVHVTPIIHSWLSTIHVVSWLWRYHFTSISLHTQCLCTPAGFFDSLLVIILLYSASCSALLHPHNSFPLHVDPDNNNIQWPIRGTLHKSSE